MVTENRFSRGMNTDTDPALLPADMYRDAVNMELTEEGGYQSLRNVKGTDLKYRFPVLGIGFSVDRAQIPWAVDSDGDLAPLLSASPFETIISALDCTARYVQHGSAQQYHAPSSIVFTLLYQETPDPFAPRFGTENPDTEFTNRIYLLNHSTGNLHCVFQGYIGLTPNLYPTALGVADQAQIRELDAYQIEETGEDFVYWVDNENPLRRIRLFVADDRRYNCAIAPYSPQRPAIPAAYLSDANALCVFKLFPPDAMTVDGVVPDGGTLSAGSYQFAYRYYNTHNNTYSKFSLFTNPLPIVNVITNVDSPHAAQLNDVAGDIPGAKTRKAIKVHVNPHPKTGDFSRMRNYYNAVQLAVVKNTDGRVQAQDLAFTLQPSTAFYNTGAFTYTGTEAEAEAVASTITLPQAAIQTAKTIEYNDGRLFLANITYFDRQHAPTIADVKTKQKFLRVKADPMVSANMHNDPLADELDFEGSGLDFINADFGYYGELNCQRFRGHFRNELYRFGVTYADQFGNFSEPSVVDCSPYGHAALGGTPAVPAAEFSFSDGVLRVTKLYYPPLAGGGPYDADGISYFLYGWIGDAITGQVFLHVHQAVADVSATLTVLGGYWMDYSRKIYSGTTVTLDAAPSGASIGESFAVSAASSVFYAPVNGLANWASPTSKDWKFPPRTDPAGHLFDQQVVGHLVEDYVRVFGLELAGITSHPDWAVAIAVTRQERKRNILGQTPIVHAAAVQNIPTMYNVKFDPSDPTAGDSKPVNTLNEYGYVGMDVPTDYNPDFRLTKLNYDYGGEEDTLVPRFLAYGATRSLGAFRITYFTLSPGSWLYKFNDWTVQWQKQECGPAQSNTTNSPAFNAHYLYVPENMAHIGSVTRDAIFLDGSEFLDAVDCVALEAFSALRNGPDLLLTPDIEGGATNFFKSDYAQYAWVFAPYGHDAYFSSGARNGHYNKSLYAKIAAIPDTSAAGILIKKGKFLDYGHQPDLLDDSYVRRGAFVQSIGAGTGILEGNLDDTQWGQNYRLIRRLDNLEALVRAGMEAQAKANNVSAASVVPPFPETNQRCIFAVVDDRDGRYIYDPTALLAESDFSALFGSGVDRLGAGTGPDHPGRRTLEKEQWYDLNEGGKTSTITMNAMVINGNAGADGGYAGQEALWQRSLQLDHNYVMAPGNAILVPIANVVKGLDDFRYGNVDAGGLSIFTGSYQALDLGVDGVGLPNDLPGGGDPNGHADASVTLEVFGGDCYVTRFQTTIRDNAVAARDMPLNPDIQFNIDINDGSGGHIPQLFTHVNRPQNHAMFVEVLDLWLESEVNGHYIANKDGLYPFQVRDRESGGRATDTSPTTAYAAARPKFQYPDTATAKVYDTPRNYYYNQGYSSENNLKVFVALPTEFPRPTSLQSRVAFSGKQVRNTLIRGFDTWLVDDFSDLLDPAYGPVTKLIFKGNNQIQAFQTRGVPGLNVGAVQSYDTGSNVIGLSSGQIIGNVNYLSTSAGTKYLSSVKRMDGIVYFVDSVNGSISVVEGNQVRSLSAGRVWALVKRLFGTELESRATGNVVGMVDVLKKKYVAFNNGDILLLDHPNTPDYAQTQGLSFNAQVNAFESRLLAPNFGNTAQVGYVNRVSGGVLTFDFINKWVLSTPGSNVYSSNGEIVAFTNANRSKMFGGNKDVGVTALANQPFGLRKTFDVALLVGSGIDVASGRTQIVVSVPDAGLSTASVPFRKDRETMFIANQMRDATTKTRMRGQWAQESIIFATETVPEPNEVVIRALRTTIRPSHRIEQ